MPPLTSTAIKRRVLLVDDHPMIVERLTQLIDRESDLTVCGSTPSRREAIAFLERDLPDLVIADISLKESHGLELIKDIKALYPNLPILVLSMYDESLYAERSLRAGARGYITKQEATTKVLIAIRQILSGDVYMGERTVARMLSRCASGGSFSASPIESLADRELEVFQMLGGGKGTREIAQELNLSIKTVESYRARIKEKLNFQTAYQLIQYASQWASGIDSK
jgi:DNA-binding NarL/FixJ family response regulator